MCGYNIWTSYICVFVITNWSGCTVNALPTPNIPESEKDPSHWNNLALSDIERRLNLRENNRIAKNVVLFIGDGLGGTTITASRILKGQLKGTPGEETVLEFEKFPNVALSKTYNVDRQTPDSAATATAILSGTKTNYYILGLNPQAQKGDCEGSKDKHVTTILDWAQAAGKSTGIVTTARLTHATPAAAYAHTPDRYWESDESTENVTCKDIAAQLIDENKNINVLFGGGRRNFLLNTSRDPEYPNKYGRRKDGRNLIKEWQKNMEELGRRYKYVDNIESFNNLSAENTDYALGMFEPSHMQYELERASDGAGEPSLAEMTSKAIQMLRRNDKGFFALIEGARIDHGHHDNLAKKALHDTLAFEEAIRVAVDMLDLDETLVIVTADHSHAFNIAGYANRGTDILGLVEPVDPLEAPTDNLPYSILIYGNGPAYSEPRTNLSGEDMHDNNFAYPSAVPMPWETHGGEDVMIYATGPMAHLFHGVHEQSYIAHVMAYSLCVGPYKENCRWTPRVETSSAIKIGFSLPKMIILVIYVIWR